jgi:transcriptional regulator with XRE-family HTH domain
MADPKRRMAFEKRYDEFLLSELLIEAMEERKISVRKLASKAGVSTTLIQNLRSGKSTNVSINTLIPILAELNYKIQIVPSH